MLMRPYRNSHAPPPMSSRTAPNAGIMSTLELRRREERCVQISEKGRRAQMVDPADEQMADLGNALLLSAQSQLPSSPPPESLFLPAPGLLLPALFFLGVLAPLPILFLFLPLLPSLPGGTDPSLTLLLSLGVS